MRIRSFLPTDQEAVRALILQGLCERFGRIDYSLNRDLDDIWLSYITKGAYVVVVEQEQNIIGSGILLHERRNVGRIMRVSVHSMRRRQGVGRQLCQHLIECARRSQFHQLLVETNEDWHSAIALYRSLEFTEFERRDGEAHLRLDL